MRRILKENWFIIFFIIAVVLLRLFVLTPVKVSGHSMDPTLADKQRLIATKLTSYDRQDIVICVEPDDTDKIAVKRLIGLPGDTVEMKDDVLTINGDVYEEPTWMISKKCLRMISCKKSIVIGKCFKKSPQARCSLRKTFPSPFLTVVILSWGTIG